MTLAPDLRARAEALGQTLPPLLAAAEHLAATVTLGEHGRRRPGMGDDFWQYRPARAGDALRLIDWRRSARSDQAFVQEREWQAAMRRVLDHADIVVPAHDFRIPVNIPEQWFAVPESLDGDLAHVPPAEAEA